MFDRCQIVAILDFEKKGTSHKHGNDTKTSLLLHSHLKDMRIFMFENGAMAAILEKCQFLAYAMNLEPNEFLKLVCCKMGIVCVLSGRLGTSVYETWGKALP